MKALLNNERAPVTFGGGFIEISFSEYCDAFTSWWKGLEIDFESFSFEAMRDFRPAAARFRCSVVRPGKVILGLAKETE